MGAIGQRYGARDVTIVGGVLASLGIILCTFAPNVMWITILWGGMHGIYKFSIYKIKMYTFIFKNVHLLRHSFF